MNKATWLLSCSALIHVASLVSVPAQDVPVHETAVIQQQWAACYGNRSMPDGVMARAQASSSKTLGCDQFQLFLRAANLQASTFDIGE